jgi:ribosomal-protein-alanine N-acetyltransferase
MHLTSGLRCAKVIPVKASAGVDARKAHPGDRMAIEALCDRARYKLPQMWHWEEHLDAEPFVVVENAKSLEGVIFAWPDGSPVAWVRTAALGHGLGMDAWLDLSLPLVLAALRRSGASALAWMDYGGWVEEHLEKRGFRPLTDVVTLSKFGRNLPAPSPCSADVRPASDADVPAAAVVDRAAFTAPWWYSEDTMRRRAGRAAHFAVATLAGEVVGYAEGELRLPVAHLNRIAVHPAHQGRGVGAALLRDALRAFWRQGAGYVTLNTQSDNVYSQRLYRRFGFEATGDFATVWELEI